MLPHDQGTEVIGAAGEIPADHELLAMMDGDLDPIGAPEGDKSQRLMKACAHMRFGRRCDEAEGKSLPARRPETHPTWARKSNRGPRT